MKTKKLVILIAVLFLFPACQSMLNSFTPKASPEMVNLINEKARKIAFSSPMKLGKTKSTRIPLKAGQWVSVLSKHIKTGDVMLNTTKIISVSGSTVVIETESYSASQKGERQLTQITIENYPVKGSLSYSKADYEATIQTMKIVKMMSKKGDEAPQVMPEQLLILSQQMAKNMTAAMVRAGELGTGPCTTAYINAALCQVYDYTVSIMGMTSNVHVFAHSDIPVNGTVKVTSEDMDNETIAFGNSGAVSLF